MAISRRRAAAIAADLNPYIGSSASSGRLVYNRADGSGGEWYGASASFAGRDDLVVIMTPSTRGQRVTADDVLARFE